MTKDKIKKIGICSDHGGFELKEKIKYFLKEKEFEVIDFGANNFNASDDFPDFVFPLAEAVANRQFFRGVAICGSGVGAAVAANKVAGVRAALITEHFSAHQGVEDDDMNMLCLGGWVTGISSAKEIVLTFLNAEFIGAKRHIRRLKKIEKYEKNRNRN